jgi:ABC-type nickel/cobalt efflux system permease component RcnA
MTRFSFLLLPAAVAALLIAGVALSGAWSFLALGFAIGMAHSFEADHLAAVGAMLNRGEGRRSMMLKGAVWGLGHTAALFIICSGVVLLGLTISDQTGAALELAVGIMIFGLGARLIWRLWCERVHIHIHDHDGHVHLHAHSHAGEAESHSASAHAHTHKQGHWATLGVGLVHGAAGSAGLLVLTVAATDSVALALVHFALFGVGSLLGMAALTVLASYPLGVVERGATWMRGAVTIAIGTLALLVGGMVAIESASALHLAGL